MVRLAVIFGLVFFVILAGGCPRKIEKIGQGGSPPNQPTSRLRDDGNKTHAKPQGKVDDDALSPGQADRDVETGAGTEVGTGEAGEGSHDDDSQPCGGQDAADAAEEVNEPASKAEAATVEDDPGAATDAGDDARVDPEPDNDEEVIEDEPLEEPKFVPEPPTLKLSREALHFAGSWQAVVYDFSGESESATAGRFVELSATGSFEATALNPPGRLESGIWGKDGDKITVSFGPAGEVEYTIDQPADNIAIWHGPNGGAMFCIRLPAETTALSPGEHYESGFGPLEFSRSGPGYWKGSYGDPEGSLVLQNAGQFLYGIWEQGKQSGYAILEFNQRGFEGFWWYSGQVSFGGEWNGELVR